MKIPSLCLFITAVLLGTVASAGAQSTPETMTITIGDTPRQTFQGFGFGLNGTALSTHPKADEVQKLLYDDLDTRFLRLWLRSSEGQPFDSDRFISDYVTSGVIADARRRGVEKILLAPTGMAGFFGLDRFEKYADFILDLKNNHNVIIDATGIQNEPQSTTAWTAESTAAAVIEYRNQLDQRGLTNVEIIPNDSWAMDPTWGDRIKGVRENADAWAAVSAISGHSYTMAATPRWADLSLGKDFWQTEAGWSKPAHMSAATRFLNDVNQRVSHWFWFIGAHGADWYGDQNNHRLIYFDGDDYAFNPTYHIFKQLLATFPVGSVFRSATSNKSLPNSQMLWTEPSTNPAIIASAAVGPDGTWRIAINNMTYGDGTSHPDFYPEATYDVTINIPELADQPDLQFIAERSKEDKNLTLVENSEQIGTVTLSGGQFVVRINPLELITLREIQPDVWNSQDIGNPSVSGSAQVGPDESVIVNGSGSDIWGTADEFHFVHQQMTGDGEITARVASMENTHGWAKAGVMIRESLSADSKHATAAMTPANGAAFQRRTGTGSTSLNTNTSGIQAPHWVRIRREGSTFSAYHSPDGVQWTPLGAETIPMGSTVYVGLAVSSHTSGSACEAVFDRITVFQPGQTVPWNSQDIGNPGISGSIAEGSDGSVTVSGSGSDIWGTADHFHFAHQTMTGDGQITARVASIEDTHDWAKAGVMIRETLNSNSKNAFCGITPANGVVFQRRTSTGGTSVGNGTADVLAPRWLRITREGSTFSAHHSRDGVYWILLGSETISMASTVYVGLAVTGHTNYSTCDAVFDQISLPASGSGSDEYIVDNTSPDAEISGSWAASSHSPGYHGSDYLHDNNSGKGTKTVRFSPNLASADTYEVFTKWTAYSNRASNVPIDIAYNGGIDYVQVDQRTGGGEWVSLGSFSFAAGSSGSVTIGTAGTDGYVIADAVRFVRQQ